MSQTLSGRSFVGKILNEAIDLAIAAAEEIAILKDEPIPFASSVEFLRVREDATRMTAQLLALISWGMAQYAVERHEVTRDYIAAEFLPTEHTAALMAESRPDSKFRSTRLSLLLLQSRDLFLRMERLKGPLTSHLEVSSQVSPSKETVHRSLTADNME